MVGHIVAHSIHARMPSLSPAKLQIVCSPSLPIQPSALNGRPLRSFRCRVHIIFFLALCPYLCLFLFPALSTLNTYPRLLHFSQYFLSNAVLFIFFLFNKGILMQLIMIFFNSKFQISLAGLVGNANWRHWACCQCGTVRSSFIHLDAILHGFDILSFFLIHYILTSYIMFNTRISVNSERYQTTEILCLGVLGVICATLPLTRTQI